MVDFSAGGRNSPLHSHGVNTPYEIRQTIANCPLLLMMPELVAWRLNFLRTQVGSPIPQPSDKEILTWFLQQWNIVIVLDLVLPACHLSQAPASCQGAARSGYAAVSKDVKECKCERNDRLEHPQTRSDKFECVSSRH